MPQTACEYWRYRAWRGRTKTASGQRRSASAQLIAEWIPCLPRDVVRGRDHAAALRVAADDQGFSAQARILELLDGGEEGIEIEVRDDHRHQE